KGRRRGLEALADQVAADREEHEDTGEAENRLTAGQDHQRIMALRVLGQQKGMREDDGKRRHQPQQVEIVVPLQAPRSQRSPATTRDARFSSIESATADCCEACRAAPNLTIEDDRPRGIRSAAGACAVMSCAAGRVSWN